MSPSYSSSSSSAICEVSAAILSRRATASALRPVDALRCGWAGAADSSSGIDALRCGRAGAASSAPAGTSISPANFFIDLSSAARRACSDSSSPLEATGVGTRTGACKGVCMGGVVMLGRISMARLGEPGGVGIGLTSPPSFGSVVTRDGISLSSSTGQILLPSPPPAPPSSSQSARRWSSAPASPSCPSFLAILVATICATGRGERADEEQTGVEMTEAAWAEGVATAAAPRRSSRF
mmetsp:Transcript_12702/g.40517  ORF Transcript_12702/g.40517 Transcript_12702/m.40517 type:complete len:238 (-) Transcript_12702:1118-1831(-)